MLEISGFNQSGNFRASSPLIQIWITFHIWLKYEMQKNFCQIFKHFRELSHHKFEHIIYSKANIMNNLAWKSVQVVFVILGFLARCISSFGALLGLELQEEVKFIFWKTLNKGSIWLPFTRIWLQRAWIGCQSQRLVHFKSESSLYQIINLFKSELYFKSNWSLNWWPVSDITQ